MSGLEGYRDDNSKQILYAGQAQLLREDYAPNADPPQCDLHAFCQRAHHGRRTEFPEDNALFERLAQPAQRPDSDYEDGMKARRRFSKEAFI